MKKMKKLTAVALALTLIGASAYSAFATPVDSVSEIGFEEPEIIQIVDPPTGAIGARGGDVHFGMVYFGMVNINTATPSQINQAHARHNEVFNLAPDEEGFLGPSESRNVPGNPYGVNYRDDRYMSLTFTNPGIGTVPVQLSVQNRAAAFFGGMTGNPLLTLTPAFTNIQPLAEGATAPTVVFNVMTFDRTTANMGAANPFAGIPGATAIGADWTARLQGNVPMDVTTAIATLVWTVVV